MPLFLGSTGKTDIILAKVFLSEAGAVLVDQVAVFVDGIQLVVIVAVVPAQWLGIGQCHCSRPQVP